jgi:allantoinase
MFEHGSRVGYWRLSCILGERNLPATVIACALAFERNPAVAADVVARGWDVCAHGWRWNATRSWMRRPSVTGSR